MSSVKSVILILLEPTLSGYVSHVPLMRKHIDFDFFEVHVMGSYLDSRILKKKYDNVYLIPFCPTSTHGLGLYLGYLSYLTFAFFKVVQLVPKIDAQVLISLGGHAYSGLVVAVTARLLRRKAVVRISEPTRYIVWSRYRYGTLISSFIKVLERLTFSLSNAVISNRDMRWYSSKIAAKQMLLSQGVDVSLFNPRVNPTFHSRGLPRLVTVARLDKQKNIQSVIEAVRLLKEKYPEVLYYIVGSGPDEADLRDKVAKSALEKHICFYGYASPELIPGLLRSCDVFVLPSFIEGLPSAVLEAMACGLPVIVGSTGYGWKEWFVHGENAFIVEGNPQSVANAIDQVTSSEVLRSRLIVNGLRHVRECHDSSKTKIKFTAIVRQLLKNS